LRHFGPRRVAHVIHGSDGVGDDEISSVFRVVSCRRIIV